MPINALDRSALQRSLKRLEDHIGGAGHVGVRAGANALARAMRKTLSARGGKDEFSFPGRPPLSKTGRGRKSIGVQAVEGTVRVGSGDFRMRLAETGVVIPAGTKTKKRSYPKGRIQKPRPWARRSLDAARPKMGDAAVDEMRKRSGKLGSVVDLGS